MCDDGRFPSVVFPAMKSSSCLHLHIKLQSTRLSENWTLDRKHLLFRCMFTTVMSRKQKSETDLARTFIDSRWYPLHSTIVEHR